MGRKSMNIPATCHEAATRFREWAERSNTQVSRVDLLARAQILEAFGGAPVPAAILNTWDFER